MDIYSALATPTRRSILELIATNEALSVSDISEKFKISQPAISQHLKILRETKLVDMEKHAQKRFYTINVHTFLEIEDWIQLVTKQWNERFDRLEVVLAREKKKLREGVK